MRETAPRLTHFLDWIKPYQNPANKLLDPPGWRISEYAGGNLPNGGYNIATACQYYENLRIASRVFSALGGTNQSAEYLRQAEEVKSGINSKDWTRDTYWRFNGTDTFNKEDKSKLQAFVVVKARKEGENIS